MFLHFRIRYVLGGAFEKLNLLDQAAECYVRGLERANFNSLRPFSSVLF